MGSWNAVTLPGMKAMAVPRLDMFLGLWAIETYAGQSLLSLAARTDWARHLAEKPPALRSGLQRETAPGGQKVAVIGVRGTMAKGVSSFGGTSTIQLRRDIRQAAADPDVAGIVLNIDSPGGTVAGTSDLADEVLAARRSKPVYAQVEDLTASAAYWVASQADKVFANTPGALVGSIGAMMTVYDSSAAAEKDGVRALVFATGPLKGAGTPGSPVTDEQARYFQSIVDGAQQDFDAAVRSGRGLTQAQLQAVRTGGVWKATEAIALGLVDGIQPLAKTVSMAARAVKTGGLPMVARGRIPMLSDRIDPRLN